MNIELIEYFLFNHPYWNKLDKVEKILIINNYLSEYNYESILTEEETKKRLLIEPVKYNTEFKVNYKLNEINYALLCYQKHINEFDYLVKVKIDPEDIYFDISFSFNTKTDLTKASKSDNVLNSFNQLTALPREITNNDIVLDNTNLLQLSSIEVNSEGVIENKNIIEEDLIMNYATNFDLKTSLSVTQGTDEDIIITPTNKLNYLVIDGITEGRIEGIPKIDTEKSSNNEIIFEEDQ